MKNIAIIGAGLSALTVATILKSSANISVFEKSRSVSGRMSTRRADLYHFDHGAQFFRAKSHAFKAFIHPMIEQGIIGPWDARFIELDKTKIVAKRNWGVASPHYVGIPSMSAIAKHLSRDLTVYRNTRIVSFKKDRNKWCPIEDSGNELGSFDWVVSTVPAEQALELLPDSLNFYTKIKSAKMKACFALMLGFENHINLDFDAANIISEDISWISINSSKPKRNKKFCLIAHSTNKWADEHIDKDRAQVLNYLCEQSSRIIGRDLQKADYKAIHGWRYANVEKQEGQSYYMDEKKNFGACGDWCIEGRVEAAFISGFNLANQLLSLITKEKVHVK
jgi:renalase